MAFGQVNQVTDIKDTEKRSGNLYMGVAPVRIIAVNPTKEEAFKLGWQGSIPEPTAMYTDKSGVPISQAAITFMLKMDESIDPNFVFPMTFRIRNRILTSQSAKTKVIDAYGNTAWVTTEQGKNHTVPLSSSGKPLSITKEYRPMYDGEDKLIDFLKKFLGIRESFRWNKDTNEFVLVSVAELLECRAQLEHVKSYFAGDVSEIRKIVEPNKNQLVKVLFYTGTYNGYEYQKVYWKAMRADSVNYRELDRCIQDDNANKRLDGCTIVAAPVQKYEPKQIGVAVPDATQVQQQAQAMPFGGPTTAPTPMAQVPVGAPDNADELPF